MPLRGNGRTIQNALRCALGIFSGKNILNFGIQKRLRAFLDPIFTRGAVKKNGSATVSAGNKRCNCRLPLRLPPIKMQSRAARRLPDFALIQIIFPLLMRKANAERI